MRDKNVAGILALFLGWVGIHRFYLGQVGLGILYAVFFWFPLFWLIALIDAIVLFSMNKEVFDVKYNKEALQRQGGYQRGFQPEYNPRPAAKPDFERSNQRPHKSTEVPVQRVPSNRPNPHKQAGLEKFKDYDYAGAIEDFKKSLEIAPQDIATHFNLACSYALVEDKANSFAHLDKAVQLGFKDFHKIKEHHALAYLRIQPEFEPFERNGFRTPPTSDSKQAKDELLSSQPDLLERLSQLAKLREHGLLTEQEFEAERQKIISG